MAEPVNIVPTDFELGLVNLLRGVEVPTLTITITRTEDHVIITTANPGDGVYVGAGPTLDAALASLCGVELPSGPVGGEPAQPESAKVLRLVGGTHAPAADARRCTAMEAA